MVKTTTLAAEANKYIVYPIIATATKMAVQPEEAKSKKLNEESISTNYIFATDTKFNQNKLTPNGNEGWATRRIIAAA